MALFFEIILGDSVGKRIALESGQKIGRKNCEIILSDPKISSQHAYIEARAGGHLFLVDNKSSNGIKIGGNRVPEIRLDAGIEVQLGRTLLRVVDQVAPPTVEAPPDTWSETLIKLMRSARSRAENKRRIIMAPFKPSVVLIFTRGVQFGERLVVGYGPRQFGPNSLDFDLKESEAPPICFELAPTDRGVRFKTSVPQKVKLNGQEIASQIVHAGDAIEIFDTEIVVGFDET